MVKKSGKWLKFNQQQHQPNASWNVSLVIHRREEKFRGWMGLWWSEAGKCEMRMRRVTIFITLFFFPTLLIFLFSILAETFRNVYYIKVKYSFLYAFAFAVLAAFIFLFDLCLFTWRVSLDFLSCDLEGKYRQFFYCSIKHPFAWIRSVSWLYFCESKITKSNLGMNSNSRQHHKM